MGQHLVQAGVVLVILGLVIGLVVPALKNPRMGVASHLQGMTNGPLLIVLGLVWSRLDLGHLWLAIAFWLALYGAYANLVATFLAALWGSASKFAPGAAGTHSSTAAQKKIVDILLATLAPAILVAMVIVLLGLL